MDFAIVSAMRITALLGLSALAQAQINNYRIGSSFTNTTTTSTDPQLSRDCQPDNCLRQCLQSPEVTPFCATYTTAVIIQTTAYPSYFAECSGNPYRISSACSCVVTKPWSVPSSSTCQPSTITVTFTPPIQTYTTTQNFTTTILQPTTTTTSVHIPTTITSDIFSNVTQTEISTTTATTEEETTTTTTLKTTTTETDTTTTTNPITVTSVNTTTITTSYPYTVITTVTNSTTRYITEYLSTTIVSVSTYDVTTTSDVTVPTTTTEISISDISVTQTVTTTSLVPTTTTGIVTSRITTSYPVTTTMAYYTTLTDTITGPPLTFTSYITQISWATTILTTSYFTTATQTVSSDIPVTFTDTETATDVEVTTFTLPASTITTSILGSLTTITLPASTVTTTVPSPTTTTAPALPGVTSVQTITTTLPGVVTTVTAAGIKTTITLPGATSVITTTTTLPGIPTTFPPITVTVTNGIATCPGPTPTTTLASALPTNYTWGCPPGFICHPPKPSGCDIFAEPPTDNYVCQPSECIVSPPFTPVTAGWGDSIDSNDTSFYPPQQDYFNLSPFAFGLSFDIFLEEVEVLEVVGSNGMQTPTTVTTGDWASQTSITIQPTPDTSGSSAKKVKRSISRRSSTVPAACYNECNNCYIDAQQSGKTPALCSKNPPSAFMQDLAGCQDCVSAHGDTTQQSLKSYVDVEFAQYLNFCQGEAAQSAVAPSSTPAQGEVSTAPSVAQSIVSQSQQAPASSTPSASAPVVASSTPAPSPTSTANPIQTSSTKPSSTSKPPSSATTSAVQFTGSGRTLHPAGIFFLALTTVLAAVLSILV